MALRPTGRVLVELRHTVQHCFAKGLADKPQVERQAAFCEACQDYQAGLVGGVENDKRNCYPRDANHGRHNYRTWISLRQTRLNPQSPMPAMIRIAFRGPTCSERMPIITTPHGGERLKRRVSESPPVAVVRALVSATSRRERTTANVHFQPKLIALDREMAS